MTWLWVEAGRYNVLPLGDRGGAELLIIRRPGLEPPGNVYRFWPPSPHLERSKVPDIRNRSFTIRTLVDRARTDEHRGTATLLADDAEIGSGQVETLPYRQTMYGMDVGRDAGPTVSARYRGPFPLEGTITRGRPTPVLGGAREPPATVAPMATPTLDQFRREVGGFFDDVLPGVLDGLDGQLARAKAWRAALYDAGLAGIDYPVDAGGRDLGSEHVAVWREESRGRVPREDAVFGIGVGMALPTVRDYGRHDLQQRFIKPGLRGDEIWCQMYSEPGSGSDLASLSTRAILDGDEWVVTGQKVWTSGAQNSQFAILLARTDLDAPKHRGITMFILPVEQNGVTVRPLVQMTGASEFNEVFLDEARIPRDWVVGEVNGGWATAVALLAHERVQTGTASMSGAATQRSKAGRSPIPVPQLVELAERQDRLDDPLVRQELAKLHAGERIVSWLGARDGIHPSIGKLWRTLQGRAAAELAARLAFPASPAWGADLDAGVDGARNSEDDYFAYHFLNCRGMSLGGGTDEIQRNTLGERALGLPREPGPDRDTPYKDLLKN